METLLPSDGEKLAKVKRELLSLHRRYTKVIKHETGSDEFKKQHEIARNGIESVLIECYGLSFPESYKRSIEHNEKAKSEYEKARERGDNCKFNIIS